MKKNLLTVSLLALFGAALVGCGDGKKKEEKPEETQTAQTDATSFPEETASGETSQEDATDTEPSGEETSEESPSALEESSGLGSTEEQKSEA